MAGKRNRQKIIDDRRAKQARRGRVIAPKFEAEREDVISQNPLVAKSEKQQRYIDAIHARDTVISVGYAGTAKTYIPTTIACDLYRTGKIEKIIFSRPNISNSPSLGAFGGDLVEKMSNWLIPVIDILNKRLGKENLEIAIKRGDIVFLPMEVIKGYSAENCFFIVDEAEDLSYDDAKKVVTRQGKGCTLVLAGDIHQSELKEKSGLKILIDVAQTNPEIDLEIIDFDRKSDIVRGPTCANWIIGFERYESKATRGGM